MPVGRQRSIHRYSLSEIRKGTDYFAERNLLGKGGEGKVYKGVVCVEAAGGKKKTVAVKRLKLDSHRFEEEIDTFSGLGHPNLVSLVGYCHESNERILVYEYMKNGSLADYLYKGVGRPPLSWERRLKICIGTARGLSYLHHGTNLPKGIIHRDVKPGNILLDQKFAAKISDFGLFKMPPQSQSKSTITTHLKGSHGYLAPEYVLYRRVTRKIDVYAFGTVLFEVLCRKTPWQRDESYYLEEDENQDENLALWARQNVEAELKGAIPSDCLNAFTDLIAACLQQDPKKRPHMSEVVKELEKGLALHMRYAETDAQKSAVMGSDKMWKKTQGRHLSGENAQKSAVKGPDKMWKKPQGRHLSGEKPVKGLRPEINKLEQNSEGGTDCTYDDLMRIISKDVNETSEDISSEFLELVSTIDGLIFKDLISEVQQ